MIKKALLTQCQNYFHFLKVVFYRIQENCNYIQLLKVHNIKYSFKYR